MIKLGSGMLTRTQGSQPRPGPTTRPSRPRPRPRTTQQGQDQGVDLVVEKRSSI